MLNFNAVEHSNLVLTSENLIYKMAANEISEQICWLQSKIKIKTYYWGIIVFNMSFFHVLITEYESDSSILLSISPFSARSL